MNIPDILRSFGLLESEVKVYLAALELGPATVIDIAKATGLSRPATYTAIDALVERGLMSAVTRGKKRLFAAEHPDRLFQYGKRKEHELAERLSDLEHAIPVLALRMGGERPIVKAYEGKEGIIAIIEGISNARPTRIDEITNVDAMQAVIVDEERKPIVSEVQRVGTRVRGLYAGANVRKAAHAEKRVLPEEFSHFKGSITIAGSLVALVTFSGKLHSVLIESVEVADTLRTLFELAWRQAKEFPEPTA